MQYKPNTVYQATVNNVEVMNVKRGKEMLKVEFLIDNPTGGEAGEKTAWIWPSIGNDLFESLLDAIEFIPDIEGGELDESQFVGTAVNVTLIEDEYTDKNGEVKKSFKINTIEKVPSKKPVTPKPTQKEKPTPKVENNEEKLPWEDEAL